MDFLIGVGSTIGFLILAIFLLMVMITIHELGHYLAGKIFGFKIYEFSIGMGKPLYQRKNKKTDEVFSIRMIPVGGYCAFGEDDATKPDSDPNSFNNKAPWKRLIVLFSGAFFNFVSAIIFAVVLLSLAGYGRVGMVGSQFQDRDFPDDPEARITLTQILNNENNTNGFVFTDEMYIKSIKGEGMTVLSITGSAGAILSDTKEGDNVELVVINQDGTNESIVTITGITERQWGALSNMGYAVPPNDDVYHNFGGALLQAVPFTFEIAGLIFEILFDLFTGQLGMDSIGGTVATVSVMGDAIGQALSGGFINAMVQIMFLLTLISINLAVFNWLPIPSLDGARMVFVIIEWIRGKPIDRNLESKIHMIGILCLFAFVIFADVFWIFNSLGMAMLL